MANILISALRQVVSTTLTRLSEQQEHLEDYEYSTLPSPRSIRLLSFHGDNIRQIKCSLETCDIDSAPPYHALSYTWGSPYDVPNLELPELWIKTSASIAQSYSTSHHKPISCNNQRLWITLNLLEALQHLSKQDSPWIEHEHLWVDAICIDQKSLEEREAQVLLMGEIYNKASSVISWLGDSLPETKLALNVIEELGKVPFDKHQEMERMPVTSESTYDSLGIRRITEREWRAFVGFSRRQWFSRVWVVQEAVFAQRLIFLCGEYTIPTDIFFKVEKLLVLSSWSSHILEPYLPMFMTVSGPKPGSVSIISQLQNDLRKDEVRFLLDIFAAMRSMHATDPRDKVYALLNIIAAALSTEPSRLPVLPNYKAELDEVFEQTTLMCIRAANDLSFLPAVQERKVRKLSTSPSWTVDWSVELSPYPLSTMQAVKGFWNPSRSMRLERPDTSVARILTFRAARICSITQVSLETEQMQQDLDLSSWVDVVLHMKAPYGCDISQGLTEILWRTVIADIAWGQHPAPAEFGQGFMYNYIGMVVYRTKGWWQSSKVVQEEDRLLRQIEAMRSLDHDSVFPDAEEAQRLFHIMRSPGNNHHAILEDIVSKIEALGYYINRVCSRRRLARTNNHLLSMVPSSAEHDDSIWIVPGLSTPFVFRKTENGNYELIGEAYVHGIMHGEAMQNAQFQKVSLQ